MIFVILAFNNIFIGDNKNHYYIISLTYLKSLKYIKFVNEKLDPLCVELLPLSKLWSLFQVQFINFNII